MGRLIMCGTTYIWKTPIMREEFLREQTVKYTGHLKDIFTDADMEGETKKRTI